MLPVLIGGMGLGAETGYWYFLQRRTQHAADVASFAAAVRKQFGDNQQTMMSVATNIATASGFVPGNINLQNPPSDGAYAGNPNAVRVTLERIQPRMFSAIFMGTRSQQLIRGRSVASLTGGGPACILALSRTDPEALRIAGNANVNLTNCTAQSNAGFDVDGNPNFSAPCLSSVTGSLAPDSALTLGCGSPQRALPAPDPFASIPEPTVPPCEPTDTVGARGTVTTVSPGYYCNGLKVAGDVHFSPGVYVIDGDRLSEDLEITSNVNVTGDGVTFYFKNLASVQLTGRATVNLTAPTSGTYSGLLFFGSRSQPESLEHLVTGTSGSSFRGAMYMPASTVTFRGNAGFAGGCTQIVANEVDIGGNPRLDDCAPSVDGVPPIMAGQVVRIVE
jgi:hypothetical protein